VGLNHRLLAALKQSSQKLSFSRSMAYGILGNQMFLNVSQLSQRKQVPRAGTKAA